MKKKWRAPKLEVLDIRMTMKGFAEASEVTTIFSGACDKENYGTGSKLHS